MSTAQSPLGLSHRQTKMALVAYGLLLVYGTWFPADRWDWSLGGLDALFTMEWPERIGRADLIINLLVYLPFGLLVALVVTRSRLAALILASLAGLGLSSCLELGQTYLPGRVTSPSDIFLNTIGSAIGAFGAAYIGRSDWLNARYQQIVSQLRDQAVGRLGLGVLSLWVIAQWAPFVPSLDLDNIKFGLSPFRSFLGGQGNHFLFGFLQYLAMLTGLMALGLRLFRNREPASLYLSALIVGTLLGKVLIMTRQLSPEALLAAVCVAVLALRLRSLRSTPLQVIALIALVSYQTLAAFKPSLVDTSLRVMNWVPFRGQMNSLNGLIDLLEPLWLFAAYAYLMYPRRQRTSEGLALRLILIAPLTLVLEWAQETVPGRYPDITDVVVGIAAFLLAYSLPLRDGGGASKAAAWSSNQPASRWRKLSFGALASIIALAALAKVYDGTTSHRYTLPALGKLPNPTLGNFRYQHPRLPAPDAEAWSKLLLENPSWVEAKRQEAASGNFHARIMLARMEPAQTDLTLLFSELMSLVPSGRGEKETIPIALAYDWLYIQWSPDQRARLLAKAELACDYQIEVIRDKYALSPYNVILYNQPLQALMMSALAIHGDATSGDCMRFAHDYWTRRVLPVWRQVLGKRGGWHEGGEYVGIGIGSAIHRLPAMWRRATGEDLFATLPGLRGFLDFELHRTRPDGTHMRIGDIANPKRSVPDLAPLALEYRHAAAYTTANSSRELKPLGFPWGHLSDASLIDPSSLGRMNAAHWFDGIGLLTARSSWADDATYVTAKAGNNYWSHTHLDQGSFTIFKGEPLAIDSGAYFDYGSEHHLNYTYQSIAHNLVTFTDPSDTEPMPREPSTDSEGKRVKGQARSIANDGGQRRVGSGWGKPAPLDLHDWEAQSDTYRTVGTVLQSTQRRDFIWVNADLTPAYTNAMSGGGDFSARTRRVERYLRTLVYMPEQELVFVHDRIRISKDDVRPRWLLHSNYRPSIGENEFRIQGIKGQLHARVLSPEKTVILPVGGPGFEFFVDDRNYDEAGRANLSARERGELVGRWRVELLPEDSGRDFDYLVAMRVSLAAPEVIGASNVPAFEIIRESSRTTVVFQETGQRILLPRGLSKPKLETLTVSP